MPPIDRVATLRSLYRSLPVSALLTVQDAFLLDQAETDSPRCQQFCEEHMRLIRPVLKEKAALKAARAEKKRVVIPEE